VIAGFHGQCEQGRLGRQAGYLVVEDVRVVADCAHFDQVKYGRMRLRFHLDITTADHSISSIAFAGHFGVEIVRGYDIADGHLILCKRACFIRADHVDAAKRLDNRELLNNRFFPGHANHSQGERYCDDDWKALWYGGYSQTDTYCEHFKDGSALKVADEHYKADNAE